MWAVAEERKFQIQLEGLIQLLAQNLYADPDVFLREMIQNAHDSITRRAELYRQHGGQEPPQPRITIVTNSAALQIEIHDNGSGMTGQELDWYLSTIGRSGTAELREQIAAADRSRAIELIGQFGIGLLSAFIVADWVAVVTKAGGHEALRWESQGGGNYTVEAAQRKETGTTVTIQLNPRYSRYLERSRLESIIRTYADFIGMPVYVNNDTEPANAVGAPWHRGYPSEQERDLAYHDFWDRKFTSETALHVFAVEESFEWADPDHPDGKARGRIRGVLGVTDRRTPDVNIRGTVDLYIHRMFIGAGNRDVLPPWAKFLQGVVECNELTPNAARDNVIRDAALAAVQQTLGKRIVRELIDLSMRSRQRFIEIMRWHSYHVLAMSVQAEHDEFFRAVADLMPLESDQGPITMSDYLQTAPEHSDGSRFVYYITEPESANQYRLLASARSIRVLNCTEAFAERFLKLYAKTWPNRVHLNRLDHTDSDIIFQPLDEEEAQRFENLQAAYRSLVFLNGRFVASVSRFQPAELPAVLTESRDNENRREMERLAEDVRIPESLRGLLKGFLHDEHEPLMLHLNADNPTIQKLASRPNLTDEVSRQALVSLYNNALMLLARELPAEAVKTMFTQYNQVIGLMLSLAEQNTLMQRTLNAREAELKELQVETAEEPELTPWASCFVALPFRDQRATEIFEALRDVVEYRPYFWQAVRADADVEMPGLWSNVKKKLLRAHFFVAILTGDLNPNVMLEIGRMEALQRPLIILRDAGAADPPADLQGLLYEQIRAAGRSDLRSEIAEMLARQQALRVLKPQQRYLSVSVLTREANLGEQASRQISRLYPVWRDFLDADETAVARQVGIPPHLVSAVKETLRGIPDTTS